MGDSLALLCQAWGEARGAVGVQALASPEQVPMTGGAQPQGRGVPGAGLKEDDGR